MDVILLVAELGHQLGDVVGVRLAVVAICRWRFVGICLPVSVTEHSTKQAREIRPKSVSKRTSKPPQVWRHKRKLLSQQRKQLIPVKAVLGRAVQENQRWSFARRDIIQSDVVDSGTTAYYGLAGVVEDLHHCVRVSERFRLTLQY